jgi:hypothetical protein
MATTVGQIAALLKLDTGDFDRKAKEAEALADKLGAKRPVLKISADVTTAMAKLGALEIAQKRVAAGEQRLGELRTKGTTKASVLTNAEASLLSARLRATAAEDALSSSTDRSTKSFDRNAKVTKDAKVGLLGLVALLGPTLIPLLAGAGAAAVGAAAGLGVLALGVVGAKTAMKAGTDTGKGYSTALGSLKTDIATLSGTAAAGGLPGFAAAIAAVHGQMIPLNAATEKLAPLIGGALSGVVRGLVALLVRLAPLAESVATGFMHGANSFANWAQNSTGPTKFVAYMSSELPKVVDFLGAMAGAIGKIVVAAGPVGGVLLSGFTALAKVIDAMPLPVLQVLVPTLISLGLAIKAIGIASAVSAGITKLSASLVTLGIAEEGATVGAAGLLTTLGPVGVAIAAVVAATEAMNVVNDHAAKGIKSQADLMKVSASGLDGLSTAYWSVHDGVAGTAQQLLDWGSQAANADIVTKRFATSQKDLDKALDDLRTQLGGTGGALQSLKDDAAAAGTKIPTVSAALRQARIDAFSATSQLNFLSNALDVLSNNAIDAESGELRLKDGMANLVTQAKANGHSLDENTAKGRANKESIIELIRGINDHAVAVGKQTGSVGKATGSLKTNEDALRTSMHQAGYTKKQIDDLIHSYAATPAEVTTKVKAEVAAAKRKIHDLQVQLDGLHDVSIGLNVYEHHYGQDPKHYSQNAAGGLIRGPGSGTSDSIYSRLSNGEYVMPAAQTKIFLPQLQQMRATPAGPAIRPRAGGMAAGGMAMVGGGDTYYVTVNLSGLVGGREAGREVVKALEPYFGSGGRMNASGGIR